MKRTITAVFSLEEIAAIVARHIILAREIEPDPEGRVEAEILACFGRNDLTGIPEVKQLRVEVTLDEARESWKG